MEEATAAEVKPQVSNPPTTAQTLPPQPPPPPPPSSAVLPPPSKKRPLESDAHSNYFKIRAVIRDLRPHFLEVLRTPDFQNCKAANEIREQLKILIELCKHMKDVASLKKSKLLDVKQEQPQHFNSHEQSQMNKVSAKPSEIKLSPPVVGLEKQYAQDGQGQGTYVVGGSAFGWNFITYSGKETVYYGRTKEQFRAAKSFT